MNLSSTPNFNLRFLHRSDGQEQAPNRMQLPAHREDKAGSSYQPAKAQRSCVRRLKAEGFSDPAMLDWTFENDNGRSPQMHHIPSLKSWRKHFVFSSAYLTGSGSLSLCNSLLSFCGRAFTGRSPMKPLNVLPVFEKRTPVLGFSRGQASFDFCGQRNFYQDRIMRSFANSPPLAIWNLASRSETCRFFFSSPATS